jgi:hypothetical protein
MGNLMTAEEDLYNESMRQLKEVIREKSVYQYQIAHFKLLSIENRIVPTVEYIQTTKILKLFLTKRIIDLRKTLKTIKSQDNDKPSLQKLKAIELTVTKQLESVKNDKQMLIELDEEVKTQRKILEDFEARKRTLLHRSQYLEMKGLKIDYHRRFSMNIIKNIRPIGPNYSKKKVFSQFILSQRLDNCGKCLDRLEKMKNLYGKFKIDSMKSTIIDLEAGIASLRREKDQLQEVHSVDLIELNRNMDLSHIITDVSTIKSQRLQLKIENNAINERIQSYIKYFYYAGL